MQMDDTSFLTKYSESNLENTIAVITAFAKISGLQANLDKTMVVPLGGNFRTDKGARISEN